MNLRMREHSVLNIWPSFTDVAISMLLIFLFFVFIQFIANSKVLARIHLEKKQEVIQQAFERTFPRELKEGKIRIILDGNLQRFTFSDHILFDTGQAVLKPDGEEILAVVGRLFQRHRWIRGKRGPEELYDSIQINGHTDNVPIRTLGFPSNWELSAARAIAVVRFFTEQLEMDTQLLTATGYGEYHPVASNDTDEGKAKNRRIEIVLVYSEVIDGTDR